MKQITDLTGHHIDTRGQIREGYNKTEPRLNSGANVTLTEPVRRPYVSIDVETTDIDPDWGQLIEFGAVVDDWVTPIESLPRFHAYIIQDRIQGAPKALAMNAKILDRIADRDKPANKDFTFLKPEQLAGLFEVWAKSWGAFCAGGSGKSAVPAGKNYQGFDKQFLKRVPRFGRVNMIHRCIDPGMMFFNPAIETEPPSTAECYKRAGLDMEVAHTAVEDAIGVIKLIRVAAARNALLVLAMNESPQTFVNDLGETVPDPRPPAARELGHKLSDYFQKTRRCQQD